MPVFVIRDEHLDYEIDGEVIAGPVSTEYSASGEPRARWMEATLYRKGDGTYVIHQVNQSVVWHLLSGGDHVRMPDRIPYGELSGSDVYCGNLAGRPGRRQCPRTLPRQEPALVLAELPQHRAISCPDYRAVIREVSTARRGDGSVSVATSEPMRELLAQAAVNDPAFRGDRPVVSM